MLPTCLWQSITIPQPPLILFETVGEGLAPPVFLEKALRFFLDTIATFTTEGIIMPWVTGGASPSPTVLKKSMVVTGWWRLFLDTKGVIIHRQIQI